MLISTVDQLVKLVWRNVNNINGQQLIVRARVGHDVGVTRSKSSQQPDDGTST